MFPETILQLAKQVLETAQAKSLRVATAESCTGGLVAGALTEIAGSSAVFERGFVTYTDAAKAELLGVQPMLLDAHGAVSGPVAKAMAEGALDASHAHVSVAVSGIAGPGGGSAQKPVGLVHFAAARSGFDTIHKAERFGDVGRQEVRMKSVALALAMLLDRIQQ